MRQKFLITRNRKRKELKIREFAVIDKDLKKVTSDQLRKDHFSLVGEETYTSESIKNSLDRGNADLIGTLRTRNIFPISAYAGEIADTIRELYTRSDATTMELFFDDRDLISSATD